MTNWCSGSWNTVPMRDISCFAFHLKGSIPAPSDSSTAADTFPATGASSPASVRANVDLPAPLGPVTVSAWPAAGDLRHLQRVRQPRTQEVAAASGVHLGLGGQPPEPGRVQHPRPVALVRAAAEAGVLRRLGDEPLAGIDHQPRLLTGSGFIPHAR